MCGIAGIYAYRVTGKAVDEGELTEIRDAMASRGPDAFGSWFGHERRIGLGHRRLSIIELNERGAQPMASADGARVVVFNGEIYNHAALREELTAKGHSFRSTSDTEVLLALYAAEGEAMLSKLRGCTPSPSGTSEGAGFFWRATPTASSLSTSRTTGRLCASRRRSPRC